MIITGALALVGMGAFIVGGYYAIMSPWGPCGPATARGALGLLLIAAGIPIGGAGLWMTLFLVLRPPVYPR